MPDRNRRSSSAWVSSSRDASDQPTDNGTIFNISITKLYRTGRRRWSRHEFNATIFRSSAKCRGRLGPGSTRTSNPSAPNPARRKPARESCKLGVIASHSSKPAGRHRKRGTPW